jgi:antitoxin component of MazEF toxin-antitoxin module
MFLGMFHTHTQPQEGTMSVSTLITRSRQQADFLALHAKALDAMSYDACHKADPKADYKTQTFVSVPYSIGGYSLGFNVSGPDSKKLMRKLRRMLAPGMWEKALSGDLLYLRKEIDDVRVEITGERDLVCTRVETDEVETYTETVRMTQAEYEASQIEGEATVLVKKQATRPVTKWQCS